MPVYAPLNALPLETSIFDHEIKLQVIASYLKSVNKITGENTVSDQYKKDFLNYLPVCRFAFNLDLANKSLKKLSTSSNYNDITVNIIAAKHYIHNIYESIAMMKYQNENIDRFDFLKDTPLIDTDGLTKIVDEKFQKLYLEMIPEEVVDATNYWMTH